MFLLLSVGIALGLMKQGAMMTVLSTLLTALAWPAVLLAATDFIDSKWTIAVNRYFFALNLKWNGALRWKEGKKLSPSSIFM
jgi:hypothetical protein